MVDSSTAAATDPTEDGYADKRMAAPWLEMVRDGERVFEEWQTKSDSIDKLYANLKKMAGTGTDRQMQLFWANLEVLKPSIYARPPVPVVQGRFKGQRKNAELIRHGSEVLERSLTTSFDMEDIHESLKGVRDDLATNSRGQIWLKFEEDDEGTQKVCYEHMSRRDFIHQPGRKWKEVGWVAKKTYLTIAKVKKRFPKADTTAMQFSERKGKGDDKKSEAYSKEKTACVIEIWSKTDHCVVWVTNGPEQVLDIRAPFLKLDKFFPCPRPAYGTLERETLIPVPDVVFYRHQLEEINEFTARISALAEALRLKGFYSSGNEDVSSAIESAIKRTDQNAILIPVSSVSAMGVGLKDAIIWLPVEQVAATIKTLIELRRQMIQDVYELTGLSDIMRGSSDPNETLGAQELKSQYGSVRVRDKQEELVRIALDASQIAGEIMAENFTPESLLLYSQYDGAPTEAEVQQQIAMLDRQVMQARSNPQIVAKAQENPEMAEQLLTQVQQQKQQLSQTVTMEKVFAFLRDERLRPFSLQIETDSTIQPNEDAAKKRTTEFLGAMGTAMAQLGPMVQQNPATAEFAGETLKFAVAPFRQGRQMEAAIDTFINQMKQAVQQPKADPAAEKAKAEAEAKARELESKVQETERKAQESQAKMAMDLQQARADLDKTNAEIKKILAQIGQINAQTDASVVAARTQVITPETMQ